MGGFNVQVGKVFDCLSSSLKAWFRSDSQIERKARNRDKTKSNIINEDETLVSSSLVYSSRKTWAGKWSLLVSAHGEYFKKSGCIRGPTDIANLLVQNLYWEVKWIRDAHWAGPKQEEKQIEEEQAAKAQNSKILVCYDDDNDYDSAITPSKPVDSLSMGDEHLDTIPATKSDEFIKSSVENFVPNPNFPKKIYSNPLFDEEIISMKIDPHSFNAESDLIESKLNHDSLIIISSNSDSFFDEFAGELILLKSIPPGIDETDCHPKEETPSTKRMLYDNLSHRPPKEFVYENSHAAIESFSPSPIPVEDSDSRMEEIDLSFNPDNPMPPSIEDDDHDSERDIPILKELLDNYFLSLQDNESYHFDISLPYRPPAKPPDDCGVLPEADHCQPLQYTVNHPIFNAHNDLLGSGTTLMEQMKQLTSMCEMFCQFIQRKQEEKRIEEEQAAKAQNSKIPICYDDDDDYDSAIIPSEPVDSLSMGDEHLDTIPATKSDEFIKSSVENFVPNPRIDETDCHPEEETPSTKRLLYDNSSPRPPKEFVYDNSHAVIEAFSPSPIPVKDSDCCMEEIDLSFNSDDPMPPSIEDDDHDSERDIPILEKLLDNYSLSLNDNESYHFDIPSPYRPPTKPPNGKT
uniref:Uncharacterized protein n=1 Tax=Tanacetum cinerariifolium TaxID=118510 RepID=A0A6L2NZS2_TANCI|nr:hypothetical protein [Tanacetum cinerariifolium]